MTCGRKDRKMTVKNRIAIVTGGAMGNGKGIAEVLASQGARVAIFDKSDILSETVAELTGNEELITAARSRLQEAQDALAGYRQQRIT